MKIQLEVTPYIVEKWSSHETEAHTANSDTLASMEGRGRRAEGESHLKKEVLNAPVLNKIY